MENKRKIGAVVAVTIILTAAMTFMATSAFYAFVLKARSTISFPGSEKIIETLNLLEREYYYEVDKTVLIDKALDNMIDSLGDPYTTYMNPDEYKKFSELVSGTYAGIGSVVLWDKDLNAVIIAKPFEGSPSEKAGLVKGDKILKIDGSDLTDTDLDGAVARMKGEKGTNVILTVLKVETGETIDVTVIRDEIHIPSVNSEMRDDIGYITISMFDPQTGSDFKENLDKLVNSGAKGILIDLRDNGGGLVESVISVANNLLDKDNLIFYTQDKDGKRVEHKAFSDGTDLPIVVLVNENTASASELLAGALRDNKSIQLVGKNTFGKGVVQATYPLTDGSVIKLTIEKYFTPNGSDINTIGLKPDYEVELTSQKDEQYQKAFEVLKSQLK